MTRLYMTRNDDAVFFVDTRCCDNNTSIFGVDASGVIIICRDIIFWGRPWCGIHSPRPTYPETCKYPRIPVSKRIVHTVANATTTWTQVNYKTANIEHMQ